MNLFTVASLRSSQWDISRRKLPRQRGDVIAVVWAPLWRHLLNERSGNGRRQRLPDLSAHIRTFNSWSVFSLHALCLFRGGEEERTLWWLLLFFTGDTRWLANLFQVKDTRGELKELQSVFSSHSFCFVELKSLKNIRYKCCNSVKVFNFFFFSFACFKMMSN